VATTAITDIRRSTSPAVLGGFTPFCAYATAAVAAGALTLGRRDA
jgi:hypothetical protein